MDSTATPFMDGLARLGQAVVNILLPPQCLRCRTILDAPTSLCPACWSQLRFIGRPLCARCGMPFEIEASDDAVCAACVRESRPLARARSAIVYDDHSRGLILMFKQGDRTDAAPVFASWMRRAGAALIADADIIVPVPLHWTRLFGRRYNQAALLAQAIARKSGIAFAPDLLVRTRRTSRLGHMGPGARAKTVRGAIKTHPRREHLLQDRRVLLIDDVLTTGSTVEACARAVSQAGARAVDVLTLARVVRPTRP